MLRRITAAQAPLTARRLVTCRLSPTATSTSPSSTTLLFTSQKKNGSLSFSVRRCSTKPNASAAADSKGGATASTAESKAQGAAGGKAEHEAARKASTASAQEEAAGGAADANAKYRPHRKDWSSHADVVYVKGVPMKGSMFKLPLSEFFIINLVFALAGIGAVYIVRPQIRYLCHHGFMGLTDDAGWVNGPWTYRFVYVLIMYPAYSFLLFLVGCVFGRRVWFSFMIHKMWSRLLTRKAAKRLEYVLDLQHY